MNTVRRCRTPLLAVLAVAAITMAGAAAAQTVKCPDGKAADGIARAGNALHCLVVQRTLPPAPDAKLLVVYLHGDGGGRIDLADDRSPAGALARELKATVLSLQRPGYVSALGVSNGTSGAGDDDYTADNLAIVADAMKNLRAVYPGRKILLAGHSGGAAMAALLAARDPDSADAWLLAACPCDVPAWRRWRASSGGSSATWTRSLSPIADVGRVPAGTRIAIVAGTRDDNTLPRFSESYAAALQARGIRTRVTYANGATQASVRWSPEFLLMAQELATALRK